MRPFHDVFLVLETQTILRYISTDGVAGRYICLMYMSIRHIEVEGMSFSVGEVAETSPSLILVVSSFLAPLCRLH